MQLKTTNNNFEHITHMKHTVETPQLRPWACTLQQQQQQTVLRSS